MADLQPPEHPLAVLPAMLNLVLVRTGKFFQNSSSHDPKHLVYTKESITQVVTAANRRFHDALDEVEIELIRAKSVMERDLSVIRSKRAERERAARALEARSPVEALENTSGGQPKAAGETQTSAEEYDKPKPDDVIMIDVPAVENRDLINQETISEHPASEKTISALQKMPRDAENSKELSISINPRSEKATSSPNGGTKEQNRDDLPEQRLETPTTANLGDNDFETMFNDTETAGGDDGINFDLNFASNVGMSQELFNPSSLQDVVMGNEDLTNFNATSNEHINSILPGIENYVNPGDNFPMADPAPAKTLPESDSKANTAAIATSAPQGFGSMQMESSFDDLFSSDGFIEGDGDYDMNGDGNIGDLDDTENWFKTAL